MAEKPRQNLLNNKNKKAPILLYRKDIVSLTFQLFFAPLLCKNLVVKKNKRLQSFCFLYNLFMGSLIYIAMGIGLIIGGIAAFITRSKSYGILINIGSGIAGAIIGVWAIKQIHFNFEEDRFTASLIASGLLSIIVVWVMALLRRKG